MVEGRAGVSMSEPETFESLTRRFDSHVPMPHRERWDIGKRAERLAEESGDKRALYEIRMRLVGFAFQAAATPHGLSKISRTLTSCGGTSGSR